MRSYKLLLKHSASNYYYRTVLHSCSEFIAPLVERGAAVDAQDANGWTPLHLACHLKMDAVVDALVSAGADVNLRNEAGEAAIHLACKVKSYTTWPFLLSTYPL